MRLSLRCELFAISMLGAAFSPIGRAVAQQADIYFIKTDSCYHNPARRVQTGFRLSGTVGLVTALHGVADCVTLFAQNDSGRVVWRGLYITAADVAKDVAVLGSDELSAAPASGLATAPSANLHDGDRLTVLGHGRGLLLKPLEVIAHPPAEPFKTFLPTTDNAASMRAALQARGSPDMSTGMVYLQGPIQPGHSGSPVLLEGTNQVVLVADGGLLEGTIDFAWAVPWSEVSLAKWTQDDARRLAGDDPSTLFSLDDDPPPAELPVTLGQHDSDGALGAGNSMNTVATLGANGQMNGFTTVSRTDTGKPFCGRLVVAILSASHRVLQTAVAKARECVSDSDKASRTEPWTAAFQDSAVGRAARVLLFHESAALATDTSELPATTSLRVPIQELHAAAVVLPYARALITSNTHSYLEGSKHVRVQAALSADGLLRVAARYENDDALEGFRAHAEISLLDAGGRAVSVIRFGSVARPPKPPGKAACTDDYQQEQLLSAQVQTVTAMAISIKYDGKFVAFPGSGFLCQDVPFRGLGMP